MVSSGAGGAEGWKGVQRVFGGHGAAASLPPNPWCCPPGTQVSGPLLAQDPASLRRGSTKKPPVASSLKRQGEPRPSLKKKKKIREVENNRGPARPARGGGAAPKSVRRRGTVLSCSSVDLLVQGDLGRWREAGMGLAWASQR